MTGTRRLTTIMAADLAGFSGHVARDEEGTVARVRAILSDIVEPAVTAQGGRIVKTMGDGVLAEFPSPNAGSRAALAIQAQMDGVGDGLAFRIGLHLCDVVAVGDDVMGDGVNLAARLEGIASPGGICVSRVMRDQIAANYAGQLRPLGPQRLKNLPDPVEVWALHPQAVGRAIDGPDAPPSVVILPFTEASAGADDFLADGIVEELTAALSGVRDFTVIARQSAYAIDRMADVRSIGRTLGVRYVVSGSVRRAGARVRVTVQMADAHTDRQIFSDRFEDEMADLFDLQDRIAARVAGALSPAVRASEIAASRALPSADRGSYALLMSAMPHFWAHRQDENDRAIALLTLALDRNPDEVRARALRAWAFAQATCYLWSDDPLVSRAKAVADAEAAALTAGDHAGSLVAIAAALSMSTPDQHRARALIERALALDPNSAWGWMRSGWMKNYVRDSRAALADFDRAAELSPRDPFMHNIEFGRAFAYGGLGEYDMAVDHARRGLEAGPGVVWANRDLAHFLALAGRPDEARVAMQTIIDTIPDLTVQRVANSMPPSAIARHPEFLDGLRRAGLPDE